MTGDRLALSLGKQPRMKRKSAMEKLLGLYSDMISGAISGWDRIRFRGTIRWLANTQGINAYLATRGILLKDFRSWATSITQKVRKACADQAERLGIPTEYLRRSGIDKEALARQIAAERGISTGDICMFSVLETCWAPEIRGNRAKRTLELEVRKRKCVFVYHYWNDPVLGFGHTRLQTWLPLNVTMCINGRHWLERQLLAESIDYVKDGNCFPFIADPDRAQQLLDSQLRTNWPELLDTLVKRNCPVIDKLFDPSPLHYYWSADETEWATDVCFRSVAALEKIYPSLLRHAMIAADSPAVLRFFGRRTVNGTVRSRAPEDVYSDRRRRYEGVRIKHWVNGNSVKAYNKAGNLLRIETTINNNRDFKVFRHPNDDTRRPATWQRMRKGVSDLHRRAQVSQACNDRYAEHLAATEVSETLRQVVDDVCWPVRRWKRRFRALNPWAAEDYRLLQFIADGRNALNGFRNKDLRRHLYPEAAEDIDKALRNKLSGRVTRRLALLRAHALIRKVPRTNRYVLTPKGQKISTAILAASVADSKQLMKLAA